MSSSRNIQSFEDFTSRVATDPQLQQDLKNDPVAALKQFTSVRDQDPWIYRGVVYSLGLAVLVIIFGVIILMIRKEGLDDKQVPTLLTALGSAAIGALAGLLAPSPQKTGG
jgi:hypothetical protein